MKKSSKTLLGFLVGVAVGAGVYAFLKSKEGQDWFERMKKSADSWKEDLADLAEKGKEKMNEWTSDESAAQKE